MRPEFADETFMERNLTTIFVLALVAIVALGLVQIVPMIRQALAIVP